MNWDPFQREVLAELGHGLYCLRERELPAVLESAEPVDPLWRALVRAAGSEALPQVALAALRRDPAAKRALWPRLRSLRVAVRTR